MGGLLLWFNESNFIRLDRGTMGEDEVTLMGCIDNEDAIFGRGCLSGERITLRLERIGDQIRALCRVPDQAWYSVGSVNIPFEGPYEAGIFACGYVDRTIYPGTPAGGGSLCFESFALCKIVDERQLHLCPILHLSVASLLSCSGLTIDINIPR